MPTRAASARLLHADVARALRIPNARTRGRAIYANKLRAGSFRGFGNPQATFAGESQIDELAAKLGIDPVELRLKNAVGPTNRDRRTPRPLLRAYELPHRVRDAQNKASALAPRRTRKRGVDYAVMSPVSGLMGTSASVQLRTDGTVAVTPAASTSARAPTL